MFLCSKNCRKLKQSLQKMYSDPKDIGLQLIKVASNKLYKVETEIVLLVLCVCMYVCIVTHVSDYRRVLD
jgi:hypothetical protein